MSSAPPPAAPQFHPLELIPFFRRFPSGRVRNLVYTFIWNCLFGAGFLLLNGMFSGRLPTGRAVLIFFVLSNFIGYAIHTLFEGGQMSGLEPWVRRHGYVARTIYYTLVPVI